MRTAQVAEQAGVNPQTLRYYERRGLLGDPPRTTGGYRCWRPDAVRTVRFVKRAQQLGFRLNEVEILLLLADGGPTACDAAQRVASAKIADIDAKINALTAMRTSLQQLLDTCTRPHVDRDCPLLDGLDDGEEVSE